ncbi:DUF1800 domain-containing protein [Aquincola sp. S2]|uniref:DUF1800 domain-containing protein n=1 Tax=Pseudaquabacterium terrae TaxID=2732868 RepID=A0ABX2EEW8_9BURK|nr:DUF1800 domain-containing protein [Aquabacterium terrae]NRF67148.1 DUF1800 domain-containing protein [Aquabacterium terrae]
MSVNLQAALAAHRFGLGEAELGSIGRDARDWLRAQIGPADVQAARAGDTLVDSAEGLKLQVAARRQTDDGPRALRDSIAADLRARLATAASTRRPFAERLALFWTNHFTVSLGKGSVRGLVGAFEREAIRPHIGGRFTELLKASTTHPAMLRYLDNHLSAGPQSRVVQRVARRSRDMGEGNTPRLTGLNENLAREVLELHTLGAAHGAGRYGPWGGYSQADVTALAALLTGWRGGLPSGPVFDPNWHEPGAKTVLGRRFDEGPQALDEVLAMLVRQPSTARFIATKLARHFVADEPPPALVDRLAEAFGRSEGDLPRVYQALLDAPEAWTPQPAKLKTPEEFVVSAARTLKLGERLVARAPDAGLAALGQRLHNAPSPAGWPDRAEEWLGPEAVWQRVEWSARLGERLGAQVDARQLAEASLGPLLGAATRQQIERASDSGQALALLLMAPEFQRR